MSGQIAFIGGGNMASAIIQGLLRQGAAGPETIQIVEPWQEARDRLRQQFNIVAQAAPGPFLAKASTVVWAVKPQTFKDAAEPAAPHTRAALHLSVAAGIPSDSIARWLGNERVVRAMPNTPALIGKGITALYARAGIDAGQKQGVERIVRSTGDLLWVDSEDKLDAVTALSGSGPAYVFYFLEAMSEAGQQMGLTQAQAYQLAVATFAGASELARSSDEAPQVLRQRVTSKGGTTHAAITSMEAAQMGPLFQQAMLAARDRARAMAREFGGA
ncbi:MAG: pyrroline-5-carboxylate reductase [Burkholderiaceae bacterium]|nr:pyrroline-5-carboxylate reductase [Rhodoferax sp.]MCP5262202.1 pyrroline-5-carboxylate reductase [Rhodoferax sp.]